MRQMLMLCHRLIHEQSKCINPAATLSIDRGSPSMDDWRIP
jgi:hypothetical protein